MGIVIRQGLKASIVSYTGAFLGYLIWLRFYPLWLSPEELGLVRVLFDAVILLSPFFKGGLSSLIVRFAPYLTTNIENERRFLGYAFVLPLVLLVLISAILLIFKDAIFTSFYNKSPLFAQYIWYVIPITFTSVYVEVVDALTRIRLRVVVPRFIREIVVRASNMLLVWLYFLDLIPLRGIVIGLILINLLHFILLFGYYINLRGNWIRPNLGIIKTRFFRPLLDYSGFMILGSGTGILVGKIDSLMITSLIGLPATGAYGIAFLIATVVELPRRVFNSLITPLVARAYRRKDFANLQDFYHRSAINLSIIGSTLFIGVWSNLNLIYNFVPNKEDYIGATSVVLFIGLSKVFDMSMGINAELIQNSKYYRWNIYLTPVLAVLTVVTNLIFIPIYGLTGAALASMLSVILYNIARFLMIWKVMGITPFKYSNLWTILLAGLAFAITEWVDLGNLYGDFAFNGIAILGFYLVPVYFLKLSPDFNSFVRNVGLRLKLIR